MVFDEVKKINGIYHRLCSCDNPDCEKTFFRAQGEINRNKKLDRPIYCSRSCGAIISNKSKKRDHDNLKSYKRQSDDNSPFRHYMKLLHNSRRKDCLVDLDDIKNVWEEQGGICPYTGLKLILPRNTSGFRKEDDLITRASIDRIDSSKPYTKDNIQYVSQMANWAKLDRSHEDMVRFCKAVADNWSIKC